jgi:nucleotide-binding universal stress UspA family protein
MRSWIMWKISAPVVVGVDGSDAAINAAKWAIDEAISRDVPLRIVHVTHIQGQPAPAAADDGFHLDVQYAEASLRAAAAAVEATGKPVKIETDILWGSPDAALINESRDAAMVCVGSVGIGAVVSELWGSTARSLAEHAYCPVAIIRSPQNAPASGTEWIVVVVEDHADNEAVIEHAMDEARLRGAPVLAVGIGEGDADETPREELDRRIEKWKEQYPDVHVFPIASHGSFTGFLACNKDESVQLAVVGRADAAGVAKIIGPHSHPLTPYGACSLLIIH